MLLLVPLLHAHPGSAPGASGAARDTIGHRIELHVGEATVELKYVAEVPERRVMEEARAAAGPGYGEQLLASLADGMRLTWEGAPLPATPVPLEDAAKGGEPGYLDFAVALRADLPGKRGTLGVVNGNFPDEPGFFATSVTLDGGLVVEETSLLKVKGGRIRDNWHGAWVKGEDAREPWVRIRPAGFTEHASAPEPLPRRMAGVATEAPAPWVMGFMGLGLVLLAWLGRKLGLRARRVLMRSRGAPESGE